jgi:hypothetical protein
MGWFLYSMGNDGDFAKCGGQYELYGLTAGGLERRPHLPLGRWSGIVGLALEVVQDDPSTNGQTITGTNADYEDGAA